MADITTFYGYKNQFAFYIENNGANPISVVSGQIVSTGDLLQNSIFSEIENTFPMTVAGDSELDILTDQYSLNLGDFTADITCSLLYNIVDMSDFTTVIDSSSVDVTFNLINFSATDQSNISFLTPLNKYFHLGPNGTDTTISSSMFVNNSLTILKFTEVSRYLVFASAYRPQFVVLSNSETSQQVICGSFNFNGPNNSLDAVFTTNEISSITGMVFDTIVLFYTSVSGS